MSANVEAVVNGQNVTTGEVRLSFVNLLEPRTNKDGSQSYGATLMVPKGDQATIDAFKEAAKTAIANQKDKKWGGVVPKKIANAFKDADTAEKENGEIYAESNPEFAGHYIVAVKSNKPIDVVNASMRPATDEEVYSGVYARAAVNAYLYEYQGRKGISYGLNAVQIIRDGEPFGGGTVKAENVFGAVVTGDISGSDDDFGDLLG